MPGNEPPPRPNDPFGAWAWDMTYGPASQNTPFAIVGQKLDGLKEDLKSVITVSKSIDEMNKTVKDTNAIMRETNQTLKVLADRLK